MDNNALTVIIILLSAGALLTLIILVIHLLKIRARRRDSMERNIPWHFPILGFHGEQVADRPPVLPLVQRHGLSSTSKTQSFSRFSWFVSEDKLLSSHYKDPRYPEAAKVAWRRSEQDGSYAI
ncbi:hypothetical protein B0H19DRAFT_1243499 [Mycena capillaripes]|nr:hypothetical protein B0H19DRAFT_1243499 [Mycena capillaripes]